MKTLRLSLKPYLMAAGGMLILAAVAARIFGVASPPFAGAVIFVGVVVAVGLLAGFRTLKSGLLYFGGGGLRLWRWRELVSLEPEDPGRYSRIVVRFQRGDEERREVIPNDFGLPTEEVISRLEAERVE